MNFLRNVVTIGGLYLLFTLLVYSQQINPLDIVTINHDVHVGRMNKEFVVSLDIHLAIKKSWHINSHSPNDTFLVPTILSFDQSAGYSVSEIIYPPDEHAALPFSRTELSLYAGKQTIRATITIPQSYRKKRIILNATVHYQACNDQICLFPVKKTFRIVVLSRK